MSRFGTSSSSDGIGCNDASVCPCEYLGGLVEYTRVSVGRDAARKKGGAF